MPVPEHKMHRERTIAALREELDEVRHLLAERKLRHKLEEARIIIERVRLFRLARKYGYNPDQPRVPAGSPDGGQWTDGGWGGGREAWRGEGREVWRGEGQLAQVGRDRIPFLARFPGASIIQEIRFFGARREANEAISRIQERDPGYRPPDTMGDPRNIEHAIARAQFETQHARDTLQRFHHLARDPGPGGKIREHEARGAMQIERDLGVRMERARGGGEDFVAIYPRGRRETWDLIGTNAREEYFNFQSFRSSLDNKILSRASERIGLDLSIMGAGNAARVRSYVETLPSYQRRTIHFIGRR